MKDLIWDSQSNVYIPETSVFKIPALKTFFFDFSSRMIFLKLSCSYRFVSSLMHVYMETFIKFVALEHIE